MLGLVVRPLGPRTSVCWRVVTLLFAATGCTAGARAEQYNKAGELDLERGDIPSALTAFDRAIELRPGFAAAHRNRGRALFLKDDARGAEKALREAIKLDPREARAMSELGRALIFRKDRREEGHAHCQKAAELQPELAMAWACLCGARGMLGRTEEAITACKKAITLDPDGMPTLVYGVYGRTLEAAGRLKEAGQAYEDALRQGPESAELLYRLAGIQARTEREAEAVKTLHRALELKPEYVQAHRTLAEFYILEKDLDNAKKYVSSAKALGAKIPPLLLEQYDAMLAGGGEGQAGP